MNLKDGDYTLEEGAAWIIVKGFSIRILSANGVVMVDVYKEGKEMDLPIASAYASDNETATGETE
jgi:hypothetical protein